MYQQTIFNRALTGFVAWLLIAAFFLTPFSTYAQLAIEQSAQTQVQESNPTQTSEPTEETPASNLPTKNNDPAQIGELDQPDTESEADDTQDTPSAIENERDRETENRSQSGESPYAFPSTANIWGGSEFDNALTQEALLDGRVSHTGSFIEQIAIPLPPGPGGSTPTFNLTYSSQNMDNHAPYGFGWSDNVPYIERQNLVGLQRYYEESFDIISSEFGRIIPTNIPNVSDENEGMYEPEIQHGPHTRFIFDDQTYTWSRFDNQGNSWTYGTTASSTIARDYQAREIARWYLTSFSDLHGNQITYHYNQGTNNPQLESIEYGPVTISFVYEDQTTYTSYEYGLPRTTNQRLEKINITKSNELLQTYDFSYDVSLVSKRSLLTTYTHTSYKKGQVYTHDGPTYDYIDSDLSFTRDEDFPIIPITQGNDIFEHYREQHPVGVRDFDKNGINEIFGYASSATRVRNFSYEYNSALNEWFGYWNTDHEVDRWDDYFIDPEPWGQLDEDPELDRIYQNFAENRVATDINGDGYSDIIRFHDDNEETHFYLREQQTFIDTEELIGSQFNGWRNYGDVVDEKGEVRTPDFNGDGLSDIFTYGGYVFHNAGTGVQHLIGRATTISTGIDRDEQLETITFFDFNNDGLLDIAQSTGSDYGRDEPALIFTQSIDGSFTRDDAGNDIEVFAVRDDNNVYATGSYFDDIDGDGDIDMLVFRDGNSEKYLYRNNSEHTERMNKVTHVSGGTIEPSYKQTTEYYSDQGVLLSPTLATPLTVVDSITVNDQVQTPVTTNYTYIGGENYIENQYSKKFAGFEQIDRTTEASDKKVTTYYHQGNGANDDYGEPTDSYAHIGLPYKKQYVDLTTDQVVREDIMINTYEQDAVDLPFYKTNYTHVTRLKQEDGFLETANEQRYSPNHGELTTQIAYGEVNYDAQDQAVQDTKNDVRRIEHSLIESSRPATTVLSHPIEAVATSAREMHSAVLDGLEDITGQAAPSYPVEVGFFRIGYAEPRIYRGSYVFETDQIVLDENQEIAAAALITEARESDGTNPRIQAFDGSCADNVTEEYWHTCNTVNNPLTIESQEIPHNSWSNFDLTFTPTGLDVLRQKQSQGQDWRVIMRMSNDYSLTNPDSIPIPSGISRYRSLFLAFNDAGTYRIEEDTLLRITIDTQLDYDIPHVFPHTVTLKDAQNQKVAETKYYYDDLAHRQVEDGLMTSSSVWLGTQDRYLETTYQHDDFGNVTHTTDPREQTTEFVYDTDGIFIDTEINALNHETTYVYDELLGIPTSVTGPNGTTQTDTIDGRGRVVEMRKTTPTGGMVTSAETAFWEDSYPNSVLTKTYFGDEPHESITYLDGFGRTIQTKTQNTRGTYTAVDTTYDESGRTESVRLPYESMISDFDSNIQDTPTSHYEYDTIDRLTRTVTPTGTESIDHNGLEVTITNKNGIDAVITRDAFGNITSVTEDIHHSHFPERPARPAITWFDQDYKRKMPITISGTPGAGVGYQVKLEIGQDATIPDGDFHVSGLSEHFPYEENDGGDFMFVSADETQTLPFWVERAEDGVAHVWVKITDDLDTDQTIYLYFDNETPNNLSNGFEVFEVFDDFVNGLTHGWWRNGFVGIYENELTLAASGWVQSPEHFSDGHAVNFRARIPLAREEAGFKHAYYFHSSNHDEAIRVVNQDNELIQSRDPSILDPDYGFYQVKLHPSQQEFYVNEELVHIENEEIQDTQVRFFDQSSNISTNSHNWLRVRWVGVTRSIPSGPTFSSAGTFESQPSGPFVPVEDLQGLFTTYYTHDAQDNLTSITDAELNERTFTYDSLGRQTAVELPHKPYAAAATYYYEYDDGGNMSKKTWPDGSELDYTHDELGRTLTLVDPETNATNTRFVYDQSLHGIGQLYQIIELDHTRTLTYDQAGNQTSETITTPGGPTFTTTHQYNEYGLLDSLTYSSGSELAHTYHQNGQLDTIDRDGQPLLQGTDYNVSGQVTLRDYANDTLETYEYDPAQEYRLVRKQTIREAENPTIGTIELPGLGGAFGGFTNPITGSKPPQPEIIYEDLAYTYDPVGNITSITDTGTIHPSLKQYAYDSVNRLVVATTTTTNLSGSNTEVGEYWYTPVGNIIIYYKTTNGAPQEQLYDYTNPTFPHALTFSTMGEFVYDENGNMKERFIYDNLHTQTLTYNTNNTLESISQPTTSTTTYTYTHHRQRFTKQTDGDPTYYPGEHTQYNGTHTNHIFSGSSRIATENNNQLTYNSKDHLYSTTLETKERGEESSRTYTPFGTMREGNNTVSNTSDTTFTYTDQQRDSESGLYYYNSRYYDPEIRRFTSVDPWEGDLLNPQTLNKYSYVVNNPIKYVDPNGELPRDTVRGFVSGAASGVSSFAADAYTAIQQPVQSVVNAGRTSISGYSQAGSLVGEFSVNPGQVGSEVREGIGITLNQFMNQTDHEISSDVAKSTVGLIGSVLGGKYLKAGKGTNDIPVLGKGSTGRSIPVTLKEAIALREIQDNLNKGRVYPLRQPMGDRRWHSSDGWQKMEYTGVDGVMVHYVQQTINGAVKAVDDFKFK